MHYSEKTPENMMYGKSRPMPQFTGAEWERFRAGDLHRIGRFDLLMPDGSAARFGKKHRPMAKKCFCTTCKALRRAKKQHREE